LSEKGSYVKYSWNIFEEVVTDVTGIEADCVSFEEPSPQEICCYNIL
jgi:hypothetical protein